ncbi:hypothetical protein PFMALIP_04926 [Plasmodium falciparum MaliPS096_E11]|nr:hypothetical protein PFMALIP_04926 [Plasmodium falciparum MaliPS096_E11]
MYYFKKEKKKKFIESTIFNNSVTQTWFLKHLILLSFHYGFILNFDIILKSIKSYSILKNWSFLLKLALASFTFYNIKTEL